MKRLMIGMLAAIILLFSAGCAKAEEDRAIITLKKQPKHQETFHELSLGELREFELQYPKKDKTEVEIWIDYYVNGKKKNNKTSLKFRSIESESDIDSFGMGLLRHVKNEPVLFLYGPNKSIRDNQVEESAWGTLKISGWQPHPGDKGIALEAGEEVVVNAYSGTTSNETRMYDLSEKEELEELVNAHEIVLLLKAKLTTMP